MLLASDRRAVLLVDAQPYRAGSSTAVGDTIEARFFEQQESLAGLCSSDLVDRTEDSFLTGHGPRTCQMGQPGTERLELLVLEDPRTRDSLVIQRVSRVRGPDGEVLRAEGILTLSRKSDGRVASASRSEWEPQSRRRVQPAST